jgi:hypothetical protein
MGGMTYTMVKVGEGTGGGLMKNPMPNVGSMWVAYVNVDDLKAAKGQVSRRDRRQGSGRGKGSRLVQHHHRSDRSDVELLGAEERLTKASTNLRQMMRKVAKG